MKAILFAPAVLLFALCTVLLTLPGADLPSCGFCAAIPQFDKLVHIGMFTLLGLCFGYPVVKSPWTLQRRLKWVLLIALLSIGYGIAIEFIQLLWIPGRSFEGWDILADSTGSLIAYVWNRNACKKIGPDGNRGRNQN